MTCLEQPDPAEVTLYTAAVSQNPAQPPLEQAKLACWRMETPIEQRPGIPFEAIAGPANPAEAFLDQPFQWLDPLDQLALSQPQLTADT